MILKAAEFAATKHRGQFRKGNLNTPYINHPIKVANLLENVGVKDVEVLVAALLHDVVEDTNTTYSDIRNVFNQRVADFVLDPPVVVHRHHRLGDQRRRWAVFAER